MKRGAAVALLALTFACGGRSALDGLDVSDVSGAAGISPRGGAAAGGTTSAGGAPGSAGRGGVSAGGVGGVGTSGAPIGGSGGTGGVLGCRSVPHYGINLQSLVDEPPEIVGFAARPGGRVWVGANFTNRTSGYATLVEYPGDGTYAQISLRQPSRGGTVALERLRAFAIGPKLETYLVLSSDANWGFGSDGTEQGYLMRWTQAGALEWTSQIDGPEARAVGVDASGNAYAFGRFQEHGYFLKLVSSSGDVRWAISDSSNVAETTGTFAVHSSGAITRARVIQLNGRLSWLVERINTEDQSVWTTLVGCPISADDAVHLEVDEADNVYVVGDAACRLTDSAGFAQGSSDWPNLPIMGEHPGAFMIHKLDASGVPQWTRQVSLGYIAGASSTAIDREGLAVLSYTKDPSVAPVVSAVTKLDPNGGLLWRQEVCADASFVATDGACATYVTGNYCGSVAGIAVQRISDAQ